VAVRVGFDTSYGVSRTGVGRYVRSLLEALEALEDPEVVPLTTAHPSSFRPLRLAQTLARETTWYPYRLERQASSAGCSVLHMPHPAVARTTHLPLVITVLDLLPLLHPELFTRRPRMRIRASLGSLKRADRILAISEYTRETVIDLLGISPERVVATPLAATAEFGPGEPDRARLRARFGIEERYVLCVGGLEPRKNLPMALRAFERVIAREPDCELVIVGPPGWRNHEFTRRLAQTTGRVRLTGFLPDADLADLYRGATCFLYPSLGEGFGLPVAEAMACGAPVVTSDRGSVPEVAGGGATIVDPEDEEATSEAILRVLRDAEFAAELSRKGRQRAALLTWERCARLTANVYRELAESAS
jgi:glycosyltransferase involved in cell wall biosynthesis